MSQSNKSSVWYRVATVKPRLQEHITTHRHEYRHHAWFILQDRHKARSHRFNATAWFIISSMNGKRDMNELWQIAQTRFGVDAPSQDELVQLLGQLYLSELIQTDVIPDIDELGQRTTLSRRQKLKQYFLNPLALRFPLFKPDRFLDRSYPYVRFLFKKQIFYGWLGLVSFALILMMMNWNELASATRLHAFTVQNMFLFAFIYPIIKLLHELGHAYAIKHRGGDVNDMGIMLMLFVPIPYVNAHSSIAFVDKQHRMLVSAMGIIVETTLAAFALLIWLNVEAGILHNICLGIMLVGGVSTLLINGNPLMKFDGYHVFADAIEAPNLYTRARKYLSYVMHSSLFGIEKSDTGVTDESEKRLFLVYAIATFIYRIFIILFILGMVLDKFFIAGILLAAWVIINQVILPTLRYIKQLSIYTELSQNRQRVYSVIGSLAFFLLFMLVIIPLPSTSTTQGILWLSEEMQIKARSSGFVRSVLVENNHISKQGEALIVTEDPLMGSRVKVLEAELRELKVRHTQKRREHLEAEQLKQEMNNAQAELDLQKQRLGELTLTSPADGRVIIPNYRDLTGQFVKQGQLLGFIVKPDHIVAQIIISEHEIALFKQESSEFEIRPFAQPDMVIKAHFRRLVPEAIKQLPSAALGIKGGGNVLVDPNDPAGLQTMEKVFQLELSLSNNSEVAAFIGSRIHVRIRHGWQPLIEQWGRSLQQLLLGKINV